MPVSQPSSILPPPSSIQDESQQALKRVEKIDQVVFLLVREIEIESLVIEVHHVLQGGGRAVVEVRRARRQSPAARELDSRGIPNRPQM